MIFIKDIKLGLIPYGPSNGMKSLAVFLDEKDGEYEDYKNDEDIKKMNLTTDEEVVAQGLMKDMLALIAKDAELENYFTSYILGRSYLHLVGDCCAAAENRKYITTLFKFIHKAAVAAQKDLIDASIPEAEEERRKAEYMRGLRAPLTSYSCTPKYFTGKDIFYENFNVLVCELPLDGNADNASMMSLVEIGKHAFSCMIVNFDNGKTIQENIQEFEKRYIETDYLTVSKNKIYLVDKGSEELAKYCFENGYRYNILNDNKYFLNI